jgi:Family of unknown function (DUF5343)
MQPVFSKLTARSRSGRPGVVAYARSNGYMRARVLDWIRSMAAKLPYLASPGTIGRILNKVIEARRPERFTQDFLKTKLGFPGGNAQVMIPLLKRLGFLGSDGAPTQLYDQFRNADTQGLAMATGLRNAYRELYERNEYAHEMKRDKLEALITEITGLERGNRVVKLVASSFEALRSFADFESDAPNDASFTPDKLPQAPVQDARYEQRASKPAFSETVGLNLQYTINLNLPETTNPDVFNAIFKSLRDNLLTRDGG